MKLNKISVLFLFLCFRIIVLADIALPKNQNHYDTKYYFANVDSFATRTFYVKKTANDKTYKIKQDAAFLLKVNGSTGEEKLEVWAVDKKSKEKSNSFTLTTQKPKEPVSSSTNYIAITFYFDKNNKLNYKQTVLKPDCYRKKQFIPILSLKSKDNGTFQQIFISILSALVLLSVFISIKIKQRTVYV
jgi:hypothetical protein